MPGHVVLTGPTGQTASGALQQSAGIDRMIRTGCQLSGGITDNVARELGNVLIDVPAGERRQFPRVTVSGKCGRNSVIEFAGQ